MPGMSRPRRRSSPERNVGATHVACSACSTVNVSVGTPGRPLVDRPEHAGGDPRDRVELLDGRVGAVRDQRAGVEQRAEGVGAVEPIGPEPVGEVPVRRRVRELHRAGDPELGEAGEVVRRQALRVLDPMP